MFVRKVGAVLVEQVAHYFGIPVEEARRLINKLVEKGELGAVEIAGLRFYFVNPQRDRRGDARLHQARLTI
jgi:hypothetical protein